MKTFQERKAFLMGAANMLEWIDNSMPTTGGNARVYEIRTFPIRECMKYLATNKT